MNDDTVHPNHYLTSPSATIHRADPDIIVGHDFLGVSLDVLLNRMRDLKADQLVEAGAIQTF